MPVGGGTNIPPCAEAGADTTVMLGALGIMGTFSIVAIGMCGIDDAITGGIDDGIVVCIGIDDGTVVCIGIDDGIAVCIDIDACSVECIGVGTAIDGMDGMGPPGILSIECIPAGNVLGIPPAIDAGISAGFDGGGCTASICNSPPTSASTFFRSSDSCLCSASISRR